MKVAASGSALPEGRGLRHLSVGTEEPERASSVGAIHYFQKQPFPKFDGQKRNYPSFRREWTDTVSTSYSIDFQIGEIRRNVPRTVEPDLKNLKSMQEVWAFLDQEYGQIMEVTSEMVDSLAAFTFSAAAKTDGMKFVELFRKWQDLRDIGELNVLNHAPMLAKVGQRFPSTATRQNYVKLRRELLKQKKTELEIMIQFMLEEWELYKEMDRLEVPKSLMGGSSRTCYRCNKSGHMQRFCPKSSRSTANANFWQEPRICPVCQEQQEKMAIPFIKQGCPPAICL